MQHGVERVSDRSGEGRLRAERKAAGRTGKPLRSRSSAKSRQRPDVMNPLTPLRCRAVAKSPPSDAFLTSARTVTLERASMRGNKTSRRTWRCGHNDDCSWLSEVHLHI